MQVISLNVVFAEVTDEGGSVGVTAIDKRPVNETRTVTTDGVAGDHRSDMKHHGSTDQAVYAYAQEDYDFWAGKLGRELTPGQFGENLTTIGIDLNNAVIGTKVKIGTALLQVSAPRIPCATFGRWLNEEQWVKRFTDQGRPGTYLRVLESGELSSGDEIEIVETPSHGVTILDHFLVHTGDRDAQRISDLVNCPNVSVEAREKFEKFLSN